MKREVHGHDGTWPEPDDGRSPGTEAMQLLACLQNADSFFPAGGVAFSWGLETLVADGLVRDAQHLQAFVPTQLRYRWNVAERPALVAAYRAADLEQIRDIDHQVEAMTLAAELREGSRRAGASLLSVHARLGTRGAQAYRTALHAGQAHGHLPVVQGWIWRGAGLSEMAAQAASAHTFCVAMLGAALRLSVIGHLDGQRILLEARAVMIELLDEPVLDVGEMYSCVPATEIAAMRHESQTARLFAN